MDAQPRSKRQKIATAVTPVVKASSEGAGRKRTAPKKKPAGSTGAAVTKKANVSKQSGKSASKRTRTSTTGSSGAQRTTRRPYRDLIVEAICHYNSRQGSSRQAIKKYIADHYSVLATSFDTSVSRALKRGVEEHLFVQNKQSFRMARGQTRRVLSGVAGKKKKKTRTTRPLPVKKWLFEELQSSAAHDFDNLCRALVDRNQAAIKDRARFERSLKAVLARNLKEGKLTHDSQTKAYALSAAAPPAASSVTSAATSGTLAAAPPSTLASAPAIATSPASPADSMSAVALADASVAVAVSTSDATH